jgi:hypothetical protein
MANQKQLDALMRGEEIWHDWREKNPTAIPELTDAYLSRAHLPGANLNRTTLIETNLEGAILADCSVYGCSAWNLRLIGANQRDLVITPRHEPKITVDNLR